MEALLQKHFPKIFDDGAVVDYIIEISKTNTVDVLREVIVSFCPNVTTNTVDKFCEAVRTQDEVCSVEPSFENSEIRISEEYEKNVFMALNVKSKTVDVLKHRVAIQELQAVVDGFDVEVVGYVYQIVANECIEKAASILVENSPVSLREDYNAYEMRHTMYKENVNKERILQRYDEAVALDKQLCAVEKKTQLKKHADGENSKIRYYGNKIVSRNGGRYLQEEKKPEWDGGSTGRVKTKGKRGKGWTA